MAYNNPFQVVVDAFTNDPTVSQTKMFGAPGLKVNGKFFATYFKGALVIKLPAERVEELVQVKKGDYFDPGMGKKMKEWLALDEQSADQWVNLAKEAKQFVESLQNRKHI